MNITSSVDERIAEQARTEFADVPADGFGLDVAAADLDAVMAALDRLPSN